MQAYLSKPVFHDQILQSTFKCFLSFMHFLDKFFTVYCRDCLLDWFREGTKLWCPEYAEYSPKKTQEKCPESYRARLRVIEEMTLFSGRQQGLSPNSLGGVVQGCASGVSVSLFSAQEAPLSFRVVYPAWCLNACLMSLVPKSSTSITS